MQPLLEHDRRPQQDTPKKNEVPLSRMPDQSLHCAMFPRVPRATSRTQTEASTQDWLRLMCHCLAHFHTLSFFSFFFFLLYSANMRFRCKIAKKSPSSIPLSRFRPESIFRNSYRGFEFPVPSPITRRKFLVRTVVCFAKRYLGDELTG